MKHLSTIDLCLATPGHRALIRDLVMRLEADRVAVIGRNGVGKSRLLEVLAGHSEPAAGRVECVGTRHLVPQRLDARRTLRDVVASPGELRRLLLDEARRTAPDFLLLDEPSQDLDAAAIAWLAAWLKDWASGLIVVSHDRRLLRLFDAYFVVAENGCRLFQGSFDELVADLERRTDDANSKYASELCRLEREERRSAANRQRRARKKAGGRTRELDRCTPRCRLNLKRSAAQVQQGKRERIRAQRLAIAREWAKKTRRALSVELPLELTLPGLPAGGDASKAQPAIELLGVGASPGGKQLFCDVTLTLDLAKARLAVVGPNASGKTTLLELMTGRRRPDVGTVRGRVERIGYVAQHASNASATLPSRQ